jgi:hypothetical protein
MPIGRRASHASSIAFFANQTRQFLQSVCIRVHPWPIPLADFSASYTPTYFTAIVTPG